MKPPRFEYFAPREVDAALELLHQRGEELRPLAGGQSLIPMLNFRLAAPAALMDLNRIAELSGIEERDGALHLGALTRHSAIEDSVLVRERCALLAEAVRHVAHRQIRNRGTVGGSVALGYPGAELPLVLVTLGAELDLRSRGGHRSVAAAEFFLGPLETALRPDELLIRVRIPLPPAGCGCAFVEVARRHGDYALAAAAVVLERDDGGAVRAARVGVTGATAVPQRVAAAESVLAGARPDGECLEAAARASFGELELLDEPRLPRAYRAELVQAVVARGLCAAAGGA